MLWINAYAICIRFHSTPEKKVQQILLNTHHCIFACFLPSYTDCGPQGYDASVRTHHYVPPRLFFNPNTLKAIRDGLRLLWLRSLKVSRFPSMTLVFVKTLQIHSYKNLPCHCQPILKSQHQQWKDWRSVPGTSPQHHPCLGLQGSREEPPEQARAGTQGLKSQQGAGRTVAQWASDSGTWAAQVQICLAHDFSFNHAYRLSSRLHLRGESQQHLKT